MIKALYAKLSFNNKNYFLKTQMIQQKGFSLLEILLSLVLFQWCLFSLWPGVKDLLSSHQCKNDLFELQSLVNWTRTNAMLRHENLSLELEPILQVKSDNQVLKRWEQSAFKATWHSQHPLLFRFNPLENHVNGHLILHCAGAIEMHLWLNRLGYSRYVT